MPLRISVLTLLVVAPACWAGDRIYPEGTHGTGELKYVNDVPVFVASGTPRQIGEAYGVLVAKPAGELLHAAPKFTERMGLKQLYPVIVRSGETLINRMPKEYAAEITAAAEASGFDRELFVFGNTMPDFYKIAGCSTVVVEPGRSETGGPIFGRNFDWPPFPGLAEHSLVMVFKPEGKHAFASIAMPPLNSVFSGINDAGLSITMNEINKTGDGAAKVDPSGLPRLYCYRRVLEECTTVAEAAELLKTLKPTTSASLTVCDTEGGAVFEVSPKTFHVRKAENEICVCTNHFLTEGLATERVCWRLDRLSKQQQGNGKLGVEDVIAELKGVNQGNWTAHSMVFEPASRTLHLALSRDGRPATDFPFRKVELKELFAAEE